MSLSSTLPRSSVLDDHLGPDVYDDMPEDIAALQVAAREAARTSRVRAVIIVSRVTTVRSTEIVDIARLKTR